MCMFLTAAEVKKAGADVLVAGSAVFNAADCAAAIKEYFYKDGISVFADYNYYPNQVVFHKVYDALVKINFAYCNTYNSSKSTGVETLLLKQSLEKNDCYHSLEEAYFKLRHGIAKVNVSLHIDDAKRICHGPHMGEHNIYVKTTFKYSNKDILLTVFIPKITTYIKPNNRDYYLGTAQKSKFTQTAQKLLLCMTKLMHQQVAQICLQV